MSPSNNLIGVSKIFEDKMDNIIDYLTRDNGANLIQFINKPSLAISKAGKMLFESKEARNYVKKLVESFGKNASSNNITDHLQELQKVKLDAIKNQIRSRHDIYDSNNHFAGFGDKHIAITGPTGGGKTTTLNLLICKGQLQVPKHIFIFMSSMAMQGNNGFYSAMAPILTYQYKTQSNASDNPNIYLFQDHEQELVKCLSSVRKAESSAKKLLILEDVRVAGANTMKKYVQPFLMGAKNANCQVVFMDHYPQRDFSTYQSCGYVVMCNPDQQTFNLVTNNQKTIKDVDSRFSKLASLEKRTVIYDKETKNLYWAFGALPLITAY